MLDQYTTEQLEAEVKRRSYQPKQSANPNFTLLKSYCKKYVDEVSISGKVNDETLALITWAALEAVYGIFIWNWVNDRIKQ